MLSCSSTDDCTFNHDLALKQSAGLWLLWRTLSLMQSPCEGRKLQTFRFNAPTFIKLKSCTKIAWEMLRVEVEWVHLTLKVHILHFSAVLCPATVLISIRRYICNFKYQKLSQYNFTSHLSCLSLDLRARTHRAFCVGLFWLAVLCVMHGHDRL